MKPGGNYAGRVDFTDLHATLTQVAGMPAPNDIDGRSFSPILTGRGGFSLRPYQVWYSPDRNQSAVLRGDWKAVWMQDTMRLFNLAQDPGEQRDLRAQEPTISAQLDSIRRVEDRRLKHPVKPK